MEHPLSPSRKHDAKSLKPSRLVVVTGFMGTGKTMTGKKLAEILGLDFLDMDQLIEAREGMTISDIFARKGEPYFRTLEEEVCKELSTRSDLVVATGGGTLVNEKSYKRFSTKGQVVLLEATVEAIAERVRGDESRPLLGESGESVPGTKSPTWRICSRNESPTYSRNGKRHTTGLEFGLTPRPFRPKKLRFASHQTLTFLPKLSHSPCPKGRCGS